MYQRSLDHPQYSSSEIIGKKRSSSRRRRRREELRMMCCSLKNLTLQGLAKLLERHPQENVAAGVDPATGVVSRDVTINAEAGVDGRLYLPPDCKGKKLPVVVYFHGGGFLLPSENAAKGCHDFVNAIVKESNVVAISSNYRLAQHGGLLPVPYEDALGTLNWALSKTDPWLAEHGDFDRLFLAGDSAGANIAHNLAMRELGNKVEGIALLCPYFWGSKRIGTETISVKAYFLAAWALVLGPDMSLDDPAMNPIVEGAPSLAGLGCERAFVCTGSEDQLVWRARTYWETLEKSGWGGELEKLQDYKGMDHVFFMNDLGSREAKDLLARLAAFFNNKKITT